MPDLQTSPKEFCFCPQNIIPTGYHEQQEETLLNLYRRTADRRVISNMVSGSEHQAKELSEDTCIKNFKELH